MFNNQFKSQIVVAYTLNFQLNPKLKHELPKQIIIIQNDLFL